MNTIIYFPVSTPDGLPINLFIYAKTFVVARLKTFGAEMSYTYA